MEKKLKFSWWEKILLHTIPPVIAGSIKLLCLTCRIVHIEDKEEKIPDGKSVVYCTWHQRMFYHFHWFGKWHVTMMISRSKDGEWAAKTARWLGFKNVRGSSRKKNVEKGGKEAMQNLIEKVKEGESAGMMVDGPRGPARIVKMGAVLIAQQTNSPLLPEMWGCDRAWVLNSWDRYLIPKPFARISVVRGKPIYVPSDATPEKLEEIRQLLEQRLIEDTKRCDDYFGTHWPEKKEKSTNPNNS